MSTTVLEAPTKRTNSVQELSVDRVVVTPDLAKTWLRNNKKNRPVSRRTVSRYAGAMSRGEWVFNGDAIRFDKEGNILDGQHRLHAVIDSDSEIEQLVVKGIERSAFATIDENKPRTAADTLAVVGEKYATELASSLRLVHQMEIGEMDQLGYGNNSPTNTQILELLDRHPGVRDSVDFSTSLYAAKAPVLPKSIIAFCHYTFQEVDHKAAIEFLEKVMTGHGIEEGDAAGKLRDVLIKDRLDPNRNLGRVSVLALTFKAFNKYREGAFVQRLFWQEREKFPTLNQ